MSKRPITEVEASVEGLKVDEIRKLNIEIRAMGPNITSATVLSNGMLFGDYALLWIRAKSVSNFRLKPVTIAK